jgi:hypothetical protein
MSTSSEDLQQQVQELRKDFEVQAATQSGAQATQAAGQTAAQAGQMSTMAAMQGGTLSTIAAGWISMVVGIFLGLAIANSRN